jgi:hypothetical protein
MEMPHPTIDIACADTLIAYPGGFCALNVPAETAGHITMFPTTPVSRAVR